MDYIASFSNFGWTYLYSGSTFWTVLIQTQINWKIKTMGENPQITVLASYKVLEILKTKKSWFQISPDSWHILRHNHLSIFLALWSNYVPSPQTNSPVGRQSLEMQCEHLCWEGHKPPPDKFPGMKYEAWCLHFPAVPRTCRSQPEPCNMSNASHTIQGTSVLHGLAHKITQVHLALLTKFIINNKTFQPQQKQMFPYSKAKADLLGDSAKQVCYRECAL